MAIAAAKSYDPEARARAKARSREADERLLASGQVSQQQMQLINGGGGLFRQKAPIVRRGPKPQLQQR